MSPPPPKQPVCYVTMPFGRKSSPSTGRVIDFDNLYRTCIQPAVQAEGATCIRADEEEGVGLIHKPIYSRLMHSELVIVDLTTFNPNVVYELGIRHAVRPGATLLIIASDERMPFDLAMSRHLTYALDGLDLVTAESAVRFTTQLRTWVREALKPKSSPDSPLFILFDDFPGLNLAKVEPPAGARARG
jgi:hypothetical protein